MDEAGVKKKRQSIKRRVGILKTAIHYLILPWRGIPMAFKSCSNFLARERGYIERKRRLWGGREDGINDLSSGCRIAIWGGERLAEMRFQFRDWDRTGLRGSLEQEF
jgi:hypothetical protein